jgi:lipopolysaccharide transport system permease protein
MSVATPCIDDDFEIVIRKSQGWIGVNWKELFNFRELLLFLTWRDLKIRYKQTALGVAWVLVQPLLTMLIFSMVFGRFARIPSQGVPYSAFVFTGLIPWMFFANGVTAASQSLVNQQHLLTKIYFLRLFVPTASIGVFFVDMVISFGLYAVILAYHRIVPSWQIVFLPALVLLTVISTLGLGYALAALTVLFRDLRHTVPFMIQILMYASPLIYPLSMLGKRAQWVLALNPMCGVIEAYRSCILGTPWNVLSLASSVVLGVSMFVFGLFYFRKTERLFADIA